MEANNPSILYSIFSDSDSEENVCSDVCGLFSVGKDNEVSGHTASCSVSLVLSSLLCLSSSKLSHAGDTGATNLLIYSQGSQRYARYLAY